MMELIGKDEQFWMGLLKTYLIDVSIKLSAKSSTIKMYVKNLFFDRLTV